MRDFHNRISIDASSEGVWQALADVEHWPAWTTTMIRVDHLDSHPLGLGSRVYIEQPKLRPAVWTVTDWRPPSQFTWTCTMPGVSLTGFHRIEGGQEGCVAIAELRVRGTLSWLTGLMAGGLIARYMQIEAEGLKRRSETR